MTGWPGWAAITDFADQAVVLPLALLVLAALRSRGRGGEAGGWAVVEGGVQLGLLLLKLAVGACGLPTAEGQIGRAHV